MSMNPADPKWLEILKARGWQTAALATASGLILVLVKCKIIPTTDSPLWVTLPFISLVVFASLFIAAVGDEIAKIIKPVDRINQWYLKRREAKAVREFIPYMTDKDREIIGYLLYHNQKMFQADQDGGYAAPLISKGIIRPSGRAGQDRLFPRVGCRLKCPTIFGLYLKRIKRRFLTSLHLPTKLRSIHGRYLGWHGETF